MLSCLSQVLGLLCSARVVPGWPSSVWVPRYQRHAADPRPLRAELWPASPGTTSSLDILAGEPRPAAVSQTPRFSSGPAVPDSKAVKPQPGTWASSRFLENSPLCPHPRGLIPNKFITNNGKRK